MDRLRIKGQGFIARARRTGDPQQRRRLLAASWVRTSR
jgi:hypothetical protein